jgi:hypothetical protein
MLSMLTVEVQSAQSLKQPGRKPDTRGTPGYVRCWQTQCKDRSKESHAQQEQS